MPAGSFGPTTSSRMDSFVGAFMDAGLCGMIGKGGRSEEVREAIRRHRGIYLCAVGGAGALAAMCTRSLDVLAFEELGCESLKVAQFDRKLSPGGGMWGGAMMFNDIVVQEEALHIVKEFGINYEQYSDDLFVMDSVESTSALLYKAVHAGATIFNCYSVEDVVFKNNVVSGVVVNWTPVLLQGMHVDPLNIMAKCVIDGTGHDSEMCRTVARKNGIRLATDTGAVIGERSLDVVAGEEEVVNGTKEIYPGLYVCGMAASAVSGTPRMGPIFGGMLLSGKKVADLIINKLK